MKALLYYLLQMIISSGILYAYYHFLLRNKRFHRYNRFYLLAATIVSILIPFLNIPVYFTPEQTNSSIVLQTLTVISSSGFEGTTAPIISEPIRTNWFTWENISYACYILIASLALLRIVFSLKKIRAIAKSNPVEKLGNIHFVNTNEPGTPFSFFRLLFWNRKIELKSEKGEQVFRHELFHIEQKHSLDIVFMELLTAVFWINPFFHLIKKELKAIHEFLADQFAVNENKKWEYAELLLMQVLNTNIHLTNPFFHNQIKRRIAMITSSSKSSYQYLRKLLVLPVAAIVAALFAFSYKEKTESDAKIKPLLQDDQNNFWDTTRPVQNKILLRTTVKLGPPPAKIIPAKELLKKWEDPKIYGVWLDGKKIKNNELSKYSSSDFSRYDISKLYGAAKKNVKYSYQVDLMTHKYYAKICHDWDTSKEIKMTKIITSDTIPRMPSDFKNCLIVIDGVIKEGLTSNDLNSTIKPEDIESISVLKDNSAITKYGDKGKNGVIEIITKKNKDIKINEVTLTDTIPDNMIFSKVEISPSFPGGEEAWKKYLQKNKDPSTPVKNGAPAGTYTVFVQFIVDKEGYLHDIKALTHFGYGMESEVIRIIKNGPQWVPAMQNGHKVTAYKKQPVTFVVTSE